MGTTESVTSIWNTHLDKVKKKHMYIEREENLEWNNAALPMILQKVMFCFQNIEKLHTVPAFNILEISDYSWELHLKDICKIRKF